jgi:protein TonB
MTPMAATMRRPPLPITRDPGEGLFANVLVESKKKSLSRWQKIGPQLSIAAHLLAVALIVLVPILIPSALPERPDVLISLIYNPPPPPPPPLPRGSALRDNARAEVPKPVTEHPRTLTAPIEVPVTPKAETQPDAGVRPEDQFGAQTGSDLGNELGMEGGVEGGVVGGVIGGVLGGTLGGTGTGPVLDYDSPPKPVRITRPQYPQEAFVKKIEGTVVVEIMIDSYGRVVRARVMQSVPLLDAAAIQTVQQWLFQPAVKHGRPVSTIAQAPVTFRIY